MGGKVTWASPLEGTSLADWKPLAVLNPRSRLSEQRRAARAACAREYRRRRKLEGNPVRGGNYYGDNWDFEE